MIKSKYNTIYEKYTILLLTFCIWGDIIITTKQREVIFMATTETRSERFVRIAEARTNKIITMLQLLGNCANKSNYEYSKDDVKQIFTAIENEVRIARTKFETSESESERKAFTLRK